MKFEWNKKSKMVVTYVACMAALTVIAKAADTYMLPEVDAGNFQQMSLEFPVTVSGRVEAQGVQALYGAEGLRVGSVAVELGDVVQPGDLLYTYDMTYLGQRIEDLERDLEKQKIQLQGAEHSRYVQAQSQKLSIDRANANYDAAVENAERREEQAKADMEAAKQALDRYLQQNPGASQEELDQLRLEFAGKEQAYQAAVSEKNALTAKEPGIRDAVQVAYHDLVAAQAALDEHLLNKPEATLQEPELPEDEPTETIDDLPKIELYQEEIEELEDSALTQDDNEDLTDWETRKAELEQAVNEADAAYKAARAAEDQYDAEVLAAIAKVDNAQREMEATLEKLNAYTDWENEKASLTQNVEDQKRAYDEAVRSGEQSIENAERQIKDASLSTGDDSSIRLQRLSQLDIEEQLETLYEIRDAEGHVYADKDGKICQVNVAIGNLMGTGVALLMEDYEQPFRFVGTADAEAVAHLRVGDSCNISFLDQNIFLDGQKIEKVNELRTDYGSEIQDDRDIKYQIVSGISSEELKQSGRAELELVTESRVYPNCVPLEAIYGDARNPFIYVVKQKTTTLGMQSIAVKVPVKILEKNDAYAAVEGNIEPGSKVILQAGKDIRDGARIKVVETA